MIQCDICREKIKQNKNRPINILKIQVDELQAADIDKYHCPACVPLGGPSILKMETKYCKMTNLEHGKSYNMEILNPSRDKEDTKDTKYSRETAESLLALCKELDKDAKDLDLELQDVADYEALVARVEVLQKQEDLFGLEYGRDDFIYTLVTKRDRYRDA